MGRPYTPLGDAVEAYIKKDTARFHTPGHKGREGGPFGVVYPWDITEVDGADSLFHADGAIAALEAEFADIYQVKRSLLSAGGATLCIQTMLALAAGKQKKVVMSRNIHRAAINAAALLDLQPVWIYPERDAGEWYLGRYSPQAVEQALEEHPDAVAVYITSPDYFGVISDIAGISGVCREKGIPLLVDNAHGAHLKFLPERFGDLHPSACGAALCSDSLHKTMPAMTGGALLQIGDGRYAEEAKRVMSLFGSTSPSYPIMLSCERAACYARDGAKEGFTYAVKRLDGIRRTALQKGFALPKGLSDPAKLSLGFAAIGGKADAFSTYLRGRGIEPEYVSETACVLMATGMNRASDFDRLLRAVEEYPAKEQAGDFVAPNLPHPAQTIPVRDAVFATQETVSVADSVGRIAAAEASPCPPGIPVVMPGELLDENAVHTLLRYGLQKIRVVL